MPNQKYDRGLRVVLIAGAGLTLSISADATAKFAAATPQTALEIFQRALSDGKVRLAMGDQAINGKDEKMQDFNNVFKRSWDNGPYV